MFRCRHYGYALIFLPPLRFLRFSPIRRLLAFAVFAADATLIAAFLLLLRLRFCQLIDAGYADITPYATLLPSSC